MPVQKFIIRGTVAGQVIEHVKPVYLCEGCGGRASFGRTMEDRRKRLWYCGTVDGEPACVGKGDKPEAA